MRIVFSLFITKPTKNYLALCMAFDITYTIENRIYIIAVMAPPKWYVFLS